jgi:hypothetical protein
MFNSIYTQQMISLVSVNRDGRVDDGLSTHSKIGIGTD